MSERPLRPSLIETTREFLPAGARLAVGSASGRIQLPTLSVHREVELIASTRCFYRFGDLNVTAAVDGNSRPLPADLPYCTRVPAGATHIAVIRDSADGFVSIHATVP